MNQAVDDMKDMKLVGSSSDRFRSPVTDAEVAEKSMKRLEKFSCRKFC